MDNYLHVLEESLIKKNTILDQIYSCSKKQEQLLKDEDFSFENFDQIVEEKDGYVEETYDRSTLACAQTPQAFDTSLLIRCMHCANEEGWIGTDDASLVERYGNVRIKAVEGDYANLKVTTPEDIH